MSFGLYIHIPFCKSVCAYCDFFRGVYDSRRAQRYVGALINNAKKAAAELRPQQAADSVYIGGGTPTVLAEGMLAAALEGIKKHIKFAEGAEFTCEGNPESFTEKKAEELKRLGVNRVSLGVQSLNGATLRALGRAHTARQAVAAVELAARRGFRVSADMMLGVPFQTEADVKAFVRAMREAGVEHLSAYMLTVHEGTPLFEAVRRGEFCPSEDESADLYEAFFRAAAECGYARYEISNAAFPGAECRHNLKYWRAEEYLGLGAGAFSMLGGRRYHIKEDLDAYLAGSCEEVTDEVMSAKELALEQTVFGLRTRFGAPAEALAAAGIDAAELLSRAGRYFTFDGGALRLKEEFWLVSDGIITKYIL